MRRGRAGGWSVLAGVVVLLALGLSLGPASDLAWGLTHHWRVSTGRWALQVPFGWRSVVPKDGHGDDGEAPLVLRRGRWNWMWGRSTDEISVREAKGAFDAVEMAQRWDRAETQMMIPGDRLEPTPASPYLRAHYRCSDVKRAYDGTISFGCFERESRWAIWYRGRRRGIHDLVAILESATEEGAPVR